MLGMMTWLVVRIIDFLTDLSNVSRLAGHGAPTVHQQTIYYVYFTAVLMGLFIGFMLSHALLHLVSAFFEYRKDRLLVECWDALSDAERSHLEQRRG